MERGGQQKFKKGINIFSKKVFLRGGTILPRGGPKNFFFALTRAHCAPLSKSPRTPLVSMLILCVWQKCRIKCVSTIQNKHYFEENKLFHSIIFVQNTLFNKTKLFVQSMFYFVCFKTFMVK